MDYQAIADAGGIPKPARKEKKTKGLKKSRLKSKREPIPEVIREAVFREKGCFCLMGLCEHCGGMAPATDLHHVPHRAHLGQDIPEHLWPINRICHSYYHDHPTEEREMFNLIESEGHKVVWKAGSKRV